MNSQSQKGISKRWALPIMIMVMLFSLQSTVFANDPALTVDTTLNIQSTTGDDEPQVFVIISEEPQWAWHPISVVNEPLDGFNAVRRTYALPPDVNPAVISTQSFDMLGQRFSFAYVVQEASSQQESREVREAIRIETSSSNLNEILPQIEQQIMYERDGFSGILSLDLSSVVSEVAGTSRTTSTATRQRTFPGLSEPDTSLIPRTITDGGVTFNLASVDWSSGNVSYPVDGHTVPTTFTANATYTAQVTSTRTTGYTTTAEYVGVVTRTMPGLILYTAVFYGEPIIEVILEGPRQQTFPNLPEPSNDLIPAFITEGETMYRLATVDWAVASSLNSYGETMRTYTANATYMPAGLANAGDAVTQTPIIPISPQQQSGQQQASGESSGAATTVLIIVLVILAMAGVGFGAFFLAKNIYGNNVTVFSVHGPGEGETVKAGKLKVNFDVDEPVVIIDAPASKVLAKTGRYDIKIAGKSLAKATGKTIRTILGTMEDLHFIPDARKDDSEYWYTANFSSYSEEPPDEGEEGGSGYPKFS